MAYRPIWKDYFVNLQYNDQDPYTEFVIRRGTYATGEIVFAGRAYNRPDPADGSFTLGPSVKMNDIVADILRQSFAPDLSAVSDAWNPDIYVSFCLWVGNNRMNNDAFGLDWSYDYNRTNGNDLRHDPVDFRLDGRQHFIQTRFTSSTLTLNLNPGSASITIQGGPGNFIYDLRTLSSNYTQISPGDKPALRYTIIQDGCSGRYVLHYVNAWGGWDSLLMSGEPVRSYNYDRKRYSHDTDNSDPTNPAGLRGVVEYVNEVTPAWTLRTGLLTGEQSSRMHHLLGSTQVWIEDLDEGRFNPVVITDSSHKEITVNGNGRKPIQYTVNVQLAGETRR